MTSKQSEKQTLTSLKQMLSSAGGLKQRYNPPILEALPLPAAVLCRRSPGNTTDLSGVSNSLGIQEGAILIIHTL